MALIILINTFYIKSVKKSLKLAWWVVSSKTFTKVLSFLSMFSWMNEPEPVAVPFCLDLWWWGEWRRVGRHRQGRIYTKNMNRGNLSLSTSTSILSLWCVLPTSTNVMMSWPDIDFITMNINNCDKYVYCISTTRTSHLLHECLNTPIFRPSTRSWIQINVLLLFSLFP